ncbi:MAG: hypothetical protein QM655_11620 [Nocardioidaceae bacterium]
MTHHRQRATVEEPEQTLIDDPVLSLLGNASARIQQTHQRLVAGEIAGEAIARWLQEICFLLDEVWSGVHAIDDLIDQRELEETQ